MKRSTLKMLIISMLLILTFVFAYIFYHTVIALRSNKQNALLGTQNFRVLGNLYGPGQKPFSRPLAVAVSNNSIYIADSGNGRVVQYSGSGKFVRSFGDTGNSNSKMLFPTDLAIGSNKRIYVADRMTGRVMQYNMDGEIENVFPVGGDRLKLKGFSPLSLGIDRNNNIYVFEVEHQRLVLFNENGKLLKILSDSGKNPQLSFVNGIAISEQDKKIYLANSNKNNIIEMSKSGEFLRNLPGFSGTADFLPRGMILHNSATNLFIAATFQHQIISYDLKTNKIVHTIGIVQGKAQAFRFPADIAFDEDMGRLYVADTGQNRVVVLEYVYK